MADYASVKSFGKQVTSDLPRLDAIILNAGMDTREFSFAEDNETTLTVNVVSTFLLGLLTLPKLMQTAKQQDTLTHLTFLGSMVQISADHQKLSSPQKGNIFASLNDPEQADMNGRYFLSKLMVMQLVEELAATETKIAKLSNQQGVLINCVNPGWCRTELCRNYNQAIGEKIGLGLIGRTAEVGARPLVHAATIAGIESHGKYLSEFKVKSTSRFQQSAEGKRVQRDLWAELMEKLEQVQPGIGHFAMSGVTISEGAGRPVDAIYVGELEYLKVHCSPVGWSDTPLPFISSTKASQLIQHIASASSSAKG
jgi:retinol dehydrogenase-12